MSEKHRSRAFGVMIVVLLLVGVVANISAVRAQDGKPVPPGPRQGECEPVPNCDQLTAAQRSANVNRANSDAQREGKAITDNDRLQARPGGSIETVSSLGQNLLPNPNACFTFDSAVDWKGSRWTFRYAGWGLQVDVSPALNYQLKHLTYERQDGVGDGFSLKMGMDKPAHGLIVSPEFKAKAGDKITVVTSYYISVNAGKNVSQANRQWVALNVKPARSTRADYTTLPTPGRHQNSWWKLSDDLTMQSDGIFQVVLQGQNDSVLDTQVYFDNVEIWINGEPMAKCLYAN